jgi:hypothetical protein
VKKSDIENFENYLDSYLKLLRKFKKDSTGKKSDLMINTTSKVKKLLNLTADLNTINSTVNHKSISHFTEKNNSTFDENKKQNETQSTNTKSVNVTNKINKFFLNKTISDSNTTSVNISQVIKNVTKIGNHNHNSTEINLNKNNSVYSRKEHVNTSIIHLNKTLNDSNPTSTGNSSISQTINIHKSQHNYNLSLSNEKGFKDIDEVYFNLKRVKLNEEFERRERQVENDLKEKLKDKSTDNKVDPNDEKNIYRNVVNISLSLIVIGLLTGILIGLIIVMYFSSKHS